MLKEHDWNIDVPLEPLALYPKIPKECCIEQLRERDDDTLGDLLGYFARGHWEKQSFAIAVNREYELAALNKQYCAVSEVKHGYFTPDYCNFEDTEKDCLFFSESPQDESSFPVTVWELRR